MDNDSHSLLPSDNVNVNTNELKELTPKNRLFLQLIGEGLTTVDAYKQAGYTGSEHAAYEMRSYLGKHLEAYLAAKGLDRSRLILAYSELLDLPLDKPEKISIGLRLKLLKEAGKLLPKAGPEDHPKITPFILNLNQSIAPNPTPTANQADNVEGSIVEEHNNP